MLTTHPLRLKFPARIYPEGAPKHPEQAAIHLPHTGTLHVSLSVCLCAAALDTCVCRHRSTATVPHLRKIVTRMFIPSAAQDGSRY